MLSAYWRARYGLAIDRGNYLRHADISNRNWPYRPGERFDLARLIIALGGDPTKLG